MHKNLFTIDEKKRIFFLDTEESSHFWDMILPFEHLMNINSSFYSILEKINLDVNFPKESSLFFKNKLTNISSIFFF
ncbi:hypothetical protein A9G24_08215 [Gilliamella sp. App6-5]|nr:hypothetical protein A9G24_08215 [Gilliamella apicola]